MQYILFFVYNILTISLSNVLAQCESNACNVTLIAMLENLKQLPKITWFIFKTKTVMAYQCLL